MHKWQQWEAASLRCRDASIPPFAVKSKNAGHSRRFRATHFVRDLSSRHRGCRSVEDDPAANPQIPALTHSDLSQVTGGVFTLIREAQLVPTLLGSGRVRSASGALPHACPGSAAAPVLSRSPPG